MARPSAVVVAVAVLTLLAAAPPLAVQAEAAPADGSAPRSSSTADPLADSRRAAEQLDFTATVIVRWGDGDGRHDATLEVQVDHGRTHISGPAAIDAGAGGRMVHRPSGWALVWPGRAGPLLVPPLDHKYDVSVGEGPSVAGRPTHEVEVRERGYVRERLAVDVATGLVLRRQQVNRSGVADRVIEVQRLALTAASAAPAVAPPRAVAHDEAIALSPGQVPKPLRTPAWLDGAYRRAGLFRRRGLVEVLYSDGLHGLSLFVQSGRLASQVRRAGERVSVGAAGGVAWAWSGGEAITWQRGDVVYTMVGDAPEDELLAAARSVPAPEAAGTASRVRASCRRMVDLLAG